MTDLLIHPEEARAIVEGRHGDPFSVLGLHQRGGRWVLLAFDPGAEALQVLAKTRVVAQQVAGCLGLFVAESIS